VCNNKKQWAFWKTVLYNGSCFLTRIKHFLSILWKLCFIHDLPILVFIIMSQPSLWFLWHVITLEPFGAFMVLSAYFMIVCLLVHLIYVSHFCGTRRLTALKHCEISNVSWNQYILVHTRFSTPFHEVIGYISRSDLEGWNRVWLREKFGVLNWLTCEFYKHIPSSEPESCSQEFPFFETQQFFTMCTGPCLVPNYLNPVHSLTPYFFHIHFNIILSVSGSFQYCCFKFQFTWVNL